MTKYFCIEVPCRSDGSVPPDIAVAIAEISQFATRKLQAMGVDPVRTLYRATWEDDPDWQKLRDILNSPEYIAMKLAEGTLGPGEPDPNCPHCHGSGTADNAQFRCLCRWRKQ